MRKLKKYNELFENIITNSIDPFQAIRSNNFTKLRLYVENGGNINITNYDNNNLLLMCPHYSKLKLAKYLIENGIDINHQNNKGNTILMMSTYQINTELMDLLLKNGADYKLKNNIGEEFFTLIKNDDYTAYQIKLMHVINKYPEALKYYEKLLTIKKFNL